MSIPERPGTGREQYLFPQVTVPPTAASVQTGVEPDIPVAAATNRSDASIGITGQVTDGDKALLPITIKIESLASYDQQIAAYITAAFSTPGIHISDLARLVNYANALGVQTPIPRFSVTPASPNVPLGVETDFETGKFAALSPPAGFTFATSGKAPLFPLLAASNGWLFVAAMLRATASPQAHHIACWVHRPGLDSGWNVAASVSASPVEVSPLTEPAIALVEYQRDVYAIVTDAGSVGAGMAGRIFVYHLATFGTLPPPWGWTRVNTTAALIGPATGMVADGGLAAIALPDRVLVAVGAYLSGGVGFQRPARSVWIGSSTDLTTWADASNPSDPAQGINGFSSLASFQSKIPAGGSFTSVTFGPKFTLDGDSYQYGWAVTDAGRMYVSQDSGETWAQQDVPTNVALNDVLVVRSAAATGKHVVFACGASGLVLVTEDSGDTWRVSSISAGAAGSLKAEEYVPGDGSDISKVTARRRELGDGTFYSLASNNTAAVGGNTPFNATMVWMVGDNKIGWSPFVSGQEWGQRWAHIEPAQTEASYRDVVMWSYEGSPTPLPTVVVSGSIRRQVPGAGAGGDDTASYRFVTITQDASGRATGSPKFSDVSGGATDADAYRIVALSAVRKGQSGASVFGVGAGGTLLKCTNPAATSPTWESLDFPSAHDLTSIVYRPGGASVSELLVLDSDGHLYRSANSGSDWITQRVGSETATRKLAVLTLDLAATEAGASLVAGANGLWCSSVELGSGALCFPSLLYLPGTGNVLLAVSNLAPHAVGATATGRVDLWVSPDRGRTFARLDTTNQAVVSWVSSVTTNVSPIPDEVQRAALVPVQTGEVAMTAGSTGIVSPDGRGASWVPAGSSGLPLPLGTFVVTTIEQRSRCTAPLGGRLVTTVLRGGQIVTATAREWGMFKLRYPPVTPGVAQEIGIGTVGVIFPSTDIPAGEKWIINPNYRFAARHLVLETQAQPWRSGTIEASSPVATFDWDRQHADVVGALGAGFTWNVTGCALFGVNFRRATVSLTIPSYDAATFPTDPARYTLFTMRSDVASAVLTRAPDGAASGTPKDTFVCAGQRWFPGQFRPGVRRYYVQVAAGATTVAYAIVDNVQDALFVARGTGDTATISTGSVLAIYCDRMWCDMSNGVRGTGGAPLPALTGADAACRIVRISIPWQPAPAPDNAWQMAHVCLGRRIDSLLTLGSGATIRRDRFERGYRSQAVPHVLTEKSTTGAVAVRQLGRPGQGWRLEYRAVRADDIETTLRPMLTDMGSAFALLFDDENAPASVELVRMDGSLDLVQAGGNLFHCGMDFSEVM